jgi:hypothetical protein
MDPIGPLIAHLILTLLAHKRFLKALIKTVILSFFCYFLSWIFLIISILRKTSELFSIF